METIKKKLSSRKFWAALVGVAVGLGMAFGLDEGTISDVAGAVVSMTSIVTYILAEANIDAAAVKIEAGEGE